ncbi:MAG: succinate dehydrogenase assembly factor 2 [Endozoicomonadaceae bacterium]|nr:succinate dehydrogenase assembly factor 2 [Endozoicomonadaceae bacterium]MCY4328958.1 succinate dehydrogenase assembly factor 2 [Endozoicomonadaceae bacterium]
MITDEQFRRILWHSRRGMLELDVLLVPFAHEAFPLLSEEEQQLYIQFIAHEDTDLFCWLLEHEQPEPVYLDIIKKIRAHAAKQQQH